MANPLQSAESLLIDVLNIGKLCITYHPDIPNNFYCLYSYNIMRFSIKIYIKKWVAVLKHANRIKKRWLRLRGSM